MLSQVSKVLLKNVIRHADTHNRIVEEDDMWRQRDTDDTSKRKDRSYRTRVSPRRELHGAHMDRSPDRTVYTDRDEDSVKNGRSTYWMQQLYAANENDPDRWGHSGYKEMYPDLFNKKRVLSESETESPSPERKPKKKNQSESHVKKKHKKDKKNKKDKKVKKHKVKKSSQHRSALESLYNDHDTKHRYRRISRSSSKSSIESEIESRKRNRSRSSSSSRRVYRKHRRSSNSPYRSASDSRTHHKIPQKNSKSTNQTESNRNHKRKKGSRVPSSSSVDSVIGRKGKSSQRDKNHKRSEEMIRKRKKRDKFRTCDSSLSSSDSD